MEKLLALTGLGGSFEVMGHSNDGTPCTCLVPLLSECSAPKTTCGQNSPNILLLLLQKQAMLVRQLEEEVVKTRQHAKETNPEIKAHIEGLQVENDHLTREVAILKETAKVSVY
jgi:hypothetical protein